MVMTSQLDYMTSSLFVWGCFVSPLKFSHWSKFHVNIITGSVVMTIIFYKGLTRNQNYPSWVFPNIWTQGQVRDTRFGMNFSNKFYWMLQNGRVTAFTVSELLRENRQRRWNYPSPPRLRLTHPNDSFLTMECFTYNKSSTYCSEIVQS